MFCSALFQAFGCVLLEVGFKQMKDYLDLIYVLKVLFYGTKFFCRDTPIFSLYRSALPTAGDRMTRKNNGYLASHTDTQTMISGGVFVAHSSLLLHCFTSKVWFVMPQLFTLQFVLITLCIRWIYLCTPLRSF